MTAKVLRASPLSVLVVAVVVALAIAGFFLTKNNATQQNQRLLRDQTAQAALIGSSEFGGIVSEITGLVGPAAQFSPRSLQAIVSGIASGTSGAKFTVDVFQATPLGFEAIAAGGPGPSVGGAASAELTPTLSEALSAKSAAGSISNPYVPAPIAKDADGDLRTIGFASRVSSGSNEVIYFSFSIDPYSAARTLTQNKGPFELLRLALYGSTKPDSRSLIIATTRGIPLQGSTASSEFAVGTHKWLIVGQARSPLAGSFANAAPWVILALGLFLALVLALTVEILVRRQRYANHLVAERTEALEQSLTDLRDAQEKLVHGERLSALGEMASVVGHELRNPLTAVMNSIFLLRRGMGDQPSELTVKHLDMAERETSKAAALAEDLTAFVRPRNPVMAQVDLADVVNEVIQATPPPETVDLTVEANNLTVMADRNQLAEVLTNLVTNAYQAVPDGGAVSVVARPNGSGAVIVVEDSGSGIDPEHAERLFEPFFTTKSTGTGLGLAIVRRLVEAHGGEISIENAKDHGAKVTVRLPVDGNEASDGAGGAGAESSGNRRSESERRTGDDRRGEPASSAAGSTESESTGDGK